MKAFLISILLISSSYAVELKKTKQDGNIAHLQTFNLTENASSFIKKSNYFDSKEDYRLGTFSLEAKETEKMVEKLKESLAKIKIADDMLKQKGKSFNDISLENTGHHSSYILEGFIIKSDSILFKDIDEVFKELQGLDWKMNKGVLLDNKFETLSYIANGKTIKKEKFDIRFSCEAPAPPTICFIKDYGRLLIGK